MILNNDNKKLSRRKRRIEQKNKMDDNMKLLMKKNKSEKKKKSLDKIKQSEIPLVNIKYDNDPKNLEKVLKELKKNHVVNKNFHEIKHEILLDYEGQFKLVGNLKVGDQIRETHTRFRNMDGYEAYINTIDQEFDSEDTVSDGYIYKLNIPQFKKNKQKSIWKRM